VANDRDTGPAQPGNRQPDSNTASQNAQTESKLPRIVTCCLDPGGNTVGFLSLHWWGPSLRVIQEMVSLDVFLKDPTATHRPLRWLAEG
jgi:hypothetical protein